MAWADDFEHIVPLVYDAALDAAVWPQLLERMMRLLGGHCGSFIARRPDGSGGRSIQLGFDPRALEQFFGYYARRNVLLQRGRHHPAGDVVSDQDVLTKTEFRRTEYYNDLLLKQENTNAVLTAFLWRDRDKFVVFNCNRSPDRPEFGAEDKARLKPLIGHLNRAIDIALRLDTFETRTAREVAAFSDAAHGVLVLDASGSVLYANPVAERLLAEQDGLAAGPEGLRAATSAQTASLYAAIARAAGGNDSGAVTLARPRRGRPLYALTAPMPAETNWLRPARRRVLLLLRDPAERPALSPPHLRALFGLTAAEARLAIRLYEGDELAAAATVLGISRHTARAHLNAVLGKTQSGRQAELIRRLAAIAALAPRPDS